jgi:hypothetical protein
MRSDAPLSMAGEVDDGFDLIIVKIANRLIQTRMHRSRAQIEGHAFARL